jgi:hypothetical protein
VVGADVSSDTYSLHPLLPTGISEDIHNTEHEDRSSRYFAKQRRGFMRRVVPLHEVMEWQKVRLFLRPPTSLFV